MLERVHFVHVSETAVSSSPAPSFPYLHIDRQAEADSAFKFILKNVNKQINKIKPPSLFETLASIQLRQHPS